MKRPEMLRNLRTYSRAKLIAFVHDLETEPTATGLRKDCPRCGRRGDVYRANGRTFIIFDGVPGRGWVANRPGVAPAFPPVDIQANVTEAELLDPTFGCGFDGAEEVTP